MVSADIEVRSAQAFREFHTDNSGKICKINVQNSNGKVTTGTGYFLSKTLIITCYHVIYGEGPSHDNPQEITIDVPYTRGGTSDSSRSISGWSVIRYGVIKSGGSPLIHSMSPSLPLSEETGNWNGRAPTEDDRLDYCLFEIDESDRAGQWTMGFQGSLQDVMASTPFRIFYELDRILPKIKKPVTLYEADELHHVSVVANTLTTDLTLDPKPAGSIRDYSTQFKRIRYGDGELLYKGDSGAPLTNTNNEIIGLHNALTGDNKNQAIPIGYIINHIRDHATPNAITALKGEWFN